MFRYIIYVFVFTAITMQTAYGQTLQGAGVSDTDRQALLKRPVAGLARFLDPAKMSMSQSYTMAFGAGRNGHGATGLYMNSIAYQLSPGMLFRVNLGVQSVLMQNGGHGGNGGNTRVVPGFDFTYKRGDKFLLQINYGAPSSGRYNFHRPGQPGLMNPVSSGQSPSDRWDVRY